MTVLHSLADVEELEAHVLFETSHLLRQPYLTTHQREEARELLSDAANACAAFNSGLRPLIAQCIDEAKQEVERLERQLRTDTTNLEDDSSSSEEHDSEALSEAERAQIMERQVCTDSEDDSSSDEEHDSEALSEAERAQIIAQIAEAFDHANGLRRLKDIVHAAHMRIGRRVTRLLNMPVREGFPPPIYE